MNFSSNLEAFIHKLQTNQELDEWYISYFIDSYVKILNPHEAFLALSIIIQKPLIENCNQYELFEIFKALQLQSHTTERPLNLGSLLNSSPRDQHLQEIIQEIKAIYDCCKKSLY